MVRFQKGKKALIGAVAGFMLMGTANAAPWRKMSSVIMLMLHTQPMKTPYRRPIVCKLQLRL